ncbi:MAG TPA: HipA domain-containing protein [Woeseiaceae bacterium]|nr:HipA domain-containing protein [Woeseiaceae bacterium]
MPDHVTIEIYRDGRWRSAATLTPDQAQQGYRGRAAFEYVTPYAADYAGPETAAAAGLSCGYPVDFDLHQDPHWPAFVLDILPTGFGRRQWLEQLELPDGPNADWPLLLHGTAFPPGNLRVAEAVAAKRPDTRVPTASGDLVPMSDHPGFTREEVIARSDAFVEYAFQHGIYAAGGSDVQGVAPKLLLTQDRDGAWHAEGRLADVAVATHWLVKRPRGSTAVDRKVLRNEAAYMRVADAMGLRVHGELTWENDCLFIPRFDRIVQDGALQRLGMESLASLANVAEYGARIPHDILCRAIIHHCRDPANDLLEYIRRDILNVVMGNKDNHARNTVVLRDEDGSVGLSPLFDFAPMYLDPEGIPRVCRWDGDAEEGGVPNWVVVIERYREQLDDHIPVLCDFGRRIERLPEVMRELGVDEDIIEHHARGIEQHAHALMRLGG